MTFPSLFSWPPSLLKDHHYGVCGLGRNGSAVVHTLLKLGAHVQAWDDHSLDTIKSHPRLTLAPLTNLKSMSALILSPGIPHYLPTPHPTAILARSQNIPILSDVELLWQVTRLSGSKARFVSITGTNGKSTTTALLRHILHHANIPCAAGGNLGPPALALPALDDDGIYVLEMSSYMLERLDTYHAHIAIMLNLTPDHLERHGNMEGYSHAKAHVFDHMNTGDLAIFGEKSSWTSELCSSLEKRSVTVLTLQERKGFSNSEAPMLPGRHNAQNIETCRAAARHLNIKESIITEAIQCFPGLDHRLQYITTIDGVQCINDSKATNAEATAHALNAYKKVIWIAGGQAKAGGIESLEPYFSHISYALLIGHDAEQFSKTLKNHAIPHSNVGTLDKAIPAALEQAKKLATPVILLSPACASFDQFKSFEERGEYFCHLVHTYNDDQER